MQKTRMRGLRAMVHFAGFVAYVSGCTNAFSLPEDIGFETLFNNHTAEVLKQQCVAIPHAIAMLNLTGHFVIQSSSQYGMGGQSFRAWLDAYWHIHKFTLREGSLCYKARRIRTGFYNDSISQGAVAPGVLFMETMPARKGCHPRIPGIPAGLCNLLAPNDNNFAVSYRIKDKKNYRYSLMTDTELHLDFDIDSLTVIGKRHFKDHFARPLHIRKGGGTHLQCEVGKGSAAGDCNGDMYGVVFEQGSSNAIDLYRLRSGKADLRELVARVPVPYAPGSMHSFGLTKDYAILPLQPFTFDAHVMMEGGDLMHAIRTKNATQTSIYIISLKDGNVQTATLDGALYYVHTVNSFQIRAISLLTPQHSITCPFHRTIQQTASIHCETRQLVTKPPRASIRSSLASQSARRSFMSQSARSLWRLK